MEEPPGLNIAALARRTGVAAPALRKWEQRYGVLSPTRTPGGQRRYSELDVARVQWLRERLAEGYRISEAAALLATPEAPAPRTASELRAALLTAVERTDAAGVELALDQALALHPLPDALEDVVRPVLVEVGERWEAGTLSIAQEHLASAAARGRVVRHLADRRGIVRGRAVLACAPGERHEIGLLVLAALLAGDGWGVVYLGADTPVGEALSVAQVVGAAIVCVSVTMPEHLDALGGGSERGGSGPRLILGGAAASRNVARLLGFRYGGDTARRALPVLARYGA